jgi:hypothetical protein
VGDIAYSVPLIVSVFLIQRECNHSIDVVPEWCQFMFQCVVEKFQPWYLRWVSPLLFPCLDGILFLGISSNFASVWFRG